ncbi:MAG: hypothetical protein KJ053_14790 [Dehalococcoidia bacterium]|nr:hypothetical protein [Dehalococcoidia bacterium]
MPQELARITGTRPRLIGGLAGLVVAAHVLGACGDDGPAAPVIDPGDGGDYRPAFDPSKFVTAVDNPYFPLKPGSRWVYESEDGSERVEVVVLAETRQVAGVTATVVRDTVTEDGELVEDTLDWYAQDSDGNVWYLGEDSKEYKDGKPASPAGSWEAGINGALPGIIMRGAPRPGDAYRQEFLKGEAEDMAEVVSTGGKESVKAGAYQDVLVTKEWTPLEPKVVEHKSYAPGIGLILEVKVAGGKSRLELIEHTP